MSLCLFNGSHWDRSDMRTIQLMAAYGVILRAPSGPSQKKCYPLIRGPLETQQYYHLVLSEGGWAGRGFKTSRWFCFWLCGAFFFSFFVTNSLLCFGDFYHHLHSLHVQQEGKKKELDLKTSSKAVFNSFCHWEFTFMSNDLYMTVCSKNVLFQSIGQMNNSVTHSNGRKFFSCTEPPSRKETRWMGWAEDQIRDYNFSVASLKNVHSTHWELVGKVVTFCLNDSWMVFMEILLMMCLGKSYFLKKRSRDCTN